MKLSEIYTYLCVYDPRSDCYYQEDFAEDQREPRNNCYCDNCFYGRDKLALEILRLREELNNG